MNITMIPVENEEELYRPHHASIIFSCRDFFKPVSEKDLEGKFIHLEPLSANVWDALTALKIFFNDFKEAAQYKCPYTGYEHFGAVPIAILAEDTAKYKHGEYRDNPHGHMAWDNDWMRHMWKGERLFEVSRISSMFLGSGFTSYTRIYDGHAKQIQVKVPLNNGDHVLCWAWEWYNK